MFSGLVGLQPSVVCGRPSHEHFFQFCALPLKNGRPVLAHALVGIVILDLGAFRAAMFVFLPRDRQASDTILFSVCPCKGPFDPSMLKRLPKCHSLLSRRASVHQYGTVQPSLSQIFVFHPGKKDMRKWSLGGVIWLSGF